MPQNPTFNVTENKRYPQWLVGQRAQNIGWPLLSGILYASGFPLFGTRYFFVLGTTLSVFILFNPFIKNAHADEPIKARFLWLIQRVALHGTGLFLAGFYWIPGTLKEFGAIPAPINSIFGILFSFFLLPHFYFFAVSILLLNHLLKSKNLKLNATPWLTSMALALFMAQLELFIPQQFPAHIGHSWLYLSPYLGLASIFGDTLFTFFNCFIAFAWILLPHKPKKKIQFSLAFLLIFIFANVMASLAQSKFPSHPLKVRFVQANIGNNQKLSAESGAVDSVDYVLNLYQRLSVEKANLNAPPFDLIIWPETAYPLLNQSYHWDLTPKMKSSNDGTLPRKKNIPLPNLFREVISNTNANLLFGGYDQNPHVSPYDLYESEYNTAFLLDSNQKDYSLYYKHLLIPFGEGLPFGPLNKPLSGLLQNISFFAAGDRFEMMSFKTQAGVDTHFMTAICYEILFPRYLWTYWKTYWKEYQVTPQMIVNLTNDSWYGDTAEPEQHLFLARWRALEYSIPILRSTNTGITVVIDPRGVESERLSVGKIGTLDLVVDLPTQMKTLFSFWGHWPLHLGFIFTWCCLIYFQWVGRNSSDGTIVSTK